MVDLGADLLARRAEALEEPAQRSSDLAMSRAADNLDEHGRFGTGRIDQVQCFGEDRERGVTLEARPVELEPALGPVMMLVVRIEPGYQRASVNDDASHAASP